MLLHLDWKMKNSYKRLLLEEELMNFTNYQRDIFGLIIGAAIVVMAAFLIIQPDKLTKRVLVEDYTGDTLTVMFTFSEEPVDITIYDPSGHEVAVTVVESGRYATYKVQGVIQHGTWYFTCPDNTPRFEYTIY